MLHQRFNFCYPWIFALKLNNGIHAEMAAAQGTELFHLNFPVKHISNGSAFSPLMLLDLTDLWASRQNATIIIDGSAGRIKGNGTFLPSFGAGSYVSHFCIDFSSATVRDSSVWVNDRAGTEPKDLLVTRGFNLFYLVAGGFVRFEGPISRNLSARVGMSFTSADNACQNAENEIPGRSAEACRNSLEAKARPICVEIIRWRERGFADELLECGLPNNDVPSKLHWRESLLAKCRAIFLLVFFG